MTSVYPVPLPAGEDGGNGLAGKGGVSGERPGRILVVDDERAIGDMFVRVLKPMSVTFSQSAAGALGRIAAGGRFAAILCDLRMPGMDGMQFYEEVEKRDPKLAKRILFVTGAACEPRFEAFLQTTGCAYLPKPIDNDELRRVVLRIASAAPEG